MHIRLGWKSLADFNKLIKDIIMMTINLNIKANVNNLTLSQIYELLQKYSLDKVKDQKIYEFNGYRFQIETEINMAINYVITELP